VGGSKSGQPVFGPRHLVDVVVVTGRVFSEAGLEKTQPSGFFLVFFGVFVFWYFLYICPEERVFRVFSVS
jgi:hypothetical protein